MLGGDLKRLFILVALPLVTAGCSTPVGPESKAEGCDFLYEAYERASEKVNLDEDWRMDEFYFELIQEVDEAREFTVLSEIRSPIEDYLVALGDVHVGWQMTYTFYSEQSEAREFYDSTPKFQGFEEELSKKQRNLSIALESHCAG